VLWGASSWARLAHALASRRGFLARRLLLVRDPHTGRLGGQVTTSGPPLMTTELTLAEPSSAGLIALLSPAWLRAHNLWAIVAPAGTDDAGLRQHCRAAGLRLLTEDEFLECRPEPRGLREPAAGLAGQRPQHPPRPHRSRPSPRLRHLVALTLLLFTLPVMLVTAALIALDGKGPIFYRQERSGLHRRGFQLYKFRSMVVDAEAGGTPRWPPPAIRA
jgi:hypothetical protein